MKYYTSTTCGYNGNGWVYDGCTTDYDESEVKYAIDAWAAAKAPAATEARLITLDELTTNLGYEQGMINPSTHGYVTTSSTPDWVYNSNYFYWTMSQYNDSASYVCRVYNDGNVLSFSVYSFTGIPGNYGVVRPVIVLPKSALSN